MGLDVYSRRKYKQGKFVYLLDDEEKTAWIGKGHIGRCRRYRLPDHVMVNGQRYTVESVEMGAYNHPRTLRHLVIPDTFVFVDCDTLYGLGNLRSVYIGKRVEQLNSFNFRLCPKLKSIRIDKENPHLKYENGIVLSKDGKTLWSAYIERPHAVIPNGVEVISGSAFMNDQKLESVMFPKSIRMIKSCVFSNCPKLRSVVLPEGFEKFRVQCFDENLSLKHIDLPSTLTDLGEMTFSDCPNLGTVVLRSPKKLDYRWCFDAILYDNKMENPYLYVPADLVEQYRQDPEWSVFKHILPIEKMPNQ
jgi:hypothetical protein